MEDRMTLLNDLVAKFEEADEARQTAAKLAARCRDYYNADQLTTQERAALEARKQPIVISNRVRRKIDWLRGLEMQSRTDPKAYPRTPAHEAGAEAITDALRFVCDDTDLDRKRSLAWDNMLVEGIGAIEVIHVTKPGKQEPDILINNYPYDMIFHDPHSRLHDFDDARYKGVVIWKDADDLTRQHPDKASEIEAGIASGDTFSGNFNDKPTWKVWADKTRKRVRVVLIHYTHDGKWCWAKFIHNTILERGESIYLDEDGSTVCPLLLQSAYIDRENNRYGVVKDMLDTQDEINKRKSKLLHQLSTRQTFAIKGAVNVTDMKRELAKPDGHVEIDPEVARDAAERGQRAFDIIPVGDQIAGQFSLLQDAKMELDLMGANSGLAGKEGGDQSGRAIMARQQGGLIEIAPLTDGLSDFTRTIYRHIWMRIRQFWKAEKWVRVTDDDRNIRFVGLNQPVTLQQHLSQMDPSEARQIAYQMGLVPNDYRLSQPVSKENNVEEIDVDIIIEEVPDQVTLEVETFTQIMNLATSQPGIVPPEMLIEMAPGLKRGIKDKLIKRIEEQSQGQGQPDPMQQQMMAMQADAQQATTDKTRAETQQKLSLASKTNVEAQRLALGY